MLQPQQPTCDIANASQTPKSTANNFFLWIMVACGVILMLIWPVMHTIAFRNILLLTGSIIGLGYLIRERSSLYQKPALPLLFILLFFVWLITHYFLFSHNLQLELEQIKGLWLRVLLACFLGIGTGLFARQYRRAQLVIWAGMLSFFVIIYGDYIWVSFTINDWSLPYRFDLGILGHKIPAVFYGLVSLALACGVISYQLTQVTRIKSHVLIFSMASIVFTFLAFVITGTKNGVALGLILIFSVFVSFLLRANKSFKSISIASTFIILICLMSYLHLKLNPEWNSFFPSVVAGIQINKYPNWRDEQTYGLPVLADGTVVGVSAYMRTAWTVAGLKLLVENPLGYGLYNKSFRYLADENLNLPPQSDIIGTHCGWLDFSLGLGIPGLLLTWTAIALAIFYSFKQKSLWSYTTRWTLAGVFIIWIFSEIFNNHFIETLFYLIALFSAGNLPTYSGPLRQDNNASSLRG